MTSGYDDDGGLVALEVMLGMELGVCDVLLGGLTREVDQAMGVL